MRAILIPVKEFALAKKRLAPYFSSADRAALARALCHDFFRMMAGVRGVDRIFVVSKEPEALEAARNAGWETIVETQQTSESASVDLASSHCVAQGVTTALRVPIDIPLAQPADIESLFAGIGAAPAALLVPSSDGTGTNALLRTPPTLFPSRFGPNSFSLHLAEAEAVGTGVRVVRNPRLELDLDEVEDLRRIGPLLSPNSEVAGWFERQSAILRSLPATPTVS